MTNSTKQSLISAARRRAKAAARADGQSHQAHLERIAREAGRDNWATFLADPTPLPGESEQPSVPQIEAQEQKPIDLYWAHIAEWTYPHTRKIQITGALIFLAITLPLLYPLSLLGLDIDPNVFGKIMGTIAWLTLVFMTGPAIVMIIRAAEATHVSIKHTAPLGALSNIWRKAIYALIVPMVCFLGIMIIVPILYPSIPLDDVKSMEMDRSLLRNITFMNGKETKPAAVISREGTFTKIAFILMDGRSIPPNMRFIPEQSDSLEMNILKTYPNNPVVRMTALLDCRTGSYRIKLLETARSATAPAAASHELTNDKEFTLLPNEQSFICNEAKSQT